MKIKFYKVGQLVNATKLNNLINLTKFVRNGKGFGINEIEIQILRNQIPKEKGRVVIVAQRQSDGAGHVKLRWGKFGDENSISATFQILDGGNLVFC